MATIPDLMRGYCDGDLVAFHELYREIAPSVFRLLMELARDADTARHHLEETFLMVHRSRSAYIKGTDPMPWIEAIARRTFIDARVGVRRFAS